VVVDVVAGWRLVKTSKRPEPVRVAVLSRLKWNTQVLPCDAAGRLKVTSLVMSLDFPLFLKISPFGVLKLIAPVETEYRERVVGGTMFAPVGMLGTGDACARMRREKAAVRLRSFMMDSSNKLLLYIYIYDVV